MAKTLILASASPRRHELLARLGVLFESTVSPIPEPECKPASAEPREWAAALAYLKARAVADGAPGCWVLGSDTVVTCAGELLGKPLDADDAARMLRLQAGRMSEVISGVSAVRRSAGGVERRIAAAVTRVWMRPASEAIDEYVRGGEWRGKAGAYGIQDTGDRLVERIAGSYSNVVGLPLPLVARLLNSVGIAANHPKDADRWPAEN